MGWVVYLHTFLFIRPFGHKVGFISVGSLYTQEAVGCVANPARENFIPQHCIDDRALATTRPEKHAKQGVKTSFTVLKPTFHSSISQTAPFIKRPQSTPVVQNLGDRDRRTSSATQDKVKQSLKKKKQKQNKQANKKARQVLLNISSVFREDKVL